VTAREKLRLCCVDCDERKTAPSEAVLLKQFNPKSAKTAWIGRLPLGKPEHHHSRPKLGS
jgi:hypothetical protein